jgi:hypothetical protein
MNKSSIIIKAAICLIATIVLWHTADAANQAVVNYLDSFENGNSQIVRTGNIDSLTIDLEHAQFRLGPGEMTLLDFGWERPSHTHRPMKSNAISWTVWPERTSSITSSIRYVYFSTIASFCRVIIARGKHLLLQKISGSNSNRRRNTHSVMSVSTCLIVSWVGFYPARIRLSSTLIFM